MWRVSTLVQLISASAFAVAQDEIEIFKGNSGPRAGSLLFNTDAGSAIIEERSVNPLFYVGTSLNRRQTRCPYPVSCSATTCCPSGTKCCGTGLKCCPTDSNCISTPRDGCCPYTAETCGGKFCANAGSVCCDTFVCPSGYTCNTTGGQTCCAAGEVKCSGACCPAGSTCSSTAGFCQRQVSSSTQQTSTTSTTSIRISRTTSTSTSTSTSTTESPSPSASSCSVQKRQTRSASCKYECWNGKLLPVVEIPNISGRTDQLYISMCSGILNTGSGRGGNKKDWDVLTYAGDGKNAKRRRRRDAKCAGFCAEQKRVFNDASRLECDEYPPAMATEGGTGAHRTCIPSDQNSGEQGKRFSEFVKKCKPPKGSNFIIRMQGGCSLTKRDFDSVQPLEARQASAASTTTFAASSNQLRDLANASSFIYVPFDDLRNGHYHLDTSFEGDVTGFSIIDSDGDSYFSSGDGAATDNSGKKSIDFDVSEVEDGDPMPAALIIDTGKSQTISYTATATPSTSSSTSLATGLPRLSGVKSLRKEASLESFLTFTGVTVWILWA